MNAKIPCVILRTLLIPFYNKNFKTLKHFLHLKGLLLFAFLVIQCQLSAQDIHWSQFHNSQVYLNPALTAVFNGDTRFHGHYRSQWNKVPVNYLTFSGAVDTKFFNPKMKNSLFGVGLIINSDEAGDSNFKTLNIGLNGAYTHQLAKKHFLTVGLQGAFYSLGFDFSDLRFDNQYGGDIFDPNLPNREPMDGTRAQFADMSIGLNYHFQNPNKRSKLDLGAAIHHLNEPNRIFLENSPDMPLPRRINIYGTGTIGFGKRFDLLLMGTGQFQGPHTEIVPSIAARFHLNITRTQETALQLGIAGRIATSPLNDSMTWDAFAPMLELYFRQWHVGLSYDINVSDFNFDYGFQGTRGFGGPEMSITYVITKVRMGEFKICPIY